MLDKYGANECVRLSAQDSSENARNYDYYVASEFSLAQEITSKTASPIVHDL